MDVAPADDDRGAAADPTASGGTGNGGGKEARPTQPTPSSLGEGGGEEDADESGPTFDPRFLELYPRSTLQKLAAKADLSAKATTQELVNKLRAWWFNKHGHTSAQTSYKALGQASDAICRFDALAHLQVPLPSRLLRQVSASPQSRSECTQTLESKGQVQSSRKSQPVIFDSVRNHAGPSPSPGSDFLPNTPRQLLNDASLLQGGASPLPLPRPITVSMV